MSLDEWHVTDVGMKLSCWIRQGGRRRSRQVTDRWQSAASPHTEQPCTIIRAQQDSDKFLMSCHEQQFLSRNLPLKPSSHILPHLLIHYFLSHQKINYRHVFWGVCIMNKCKTFPSVWTGWPGDESVSRAVSTCELWLICVNVHTSLVKCWRRTGPVLM